MVSETAPTKWRATALGGLVGGYPFGYMLCSLTALVVRAALGIGVPLLARHPAGAPSSLGAAGCQESPRFERVTSAMLTEGLKKRLNIWSPIREYPREMLTRPCCISSIFSPGSVWSAWMPQFLANESISGFRQRRAIFRSGCSAAIFAYYLCGWLSDLFGRRLRHFRASSSQLLYFWSYWDTSTLRRACSGWDWS